MEVRNVTSAFLSANKEEHKMPKYCPPLTDRMISQVVAGCQQGDGRVVGLLLEHTKDGVRRWKYRFRVPTGAWTNRVLGNYPDLSIEGARAIAGRMAAEVWQDKVPVRTHEESRRQAEKIREINASPKFETVAAEWVNFKSYAKTENNLRVIKSRIKHVNTLWYDKHISEITSLEALEALRDIAKRTPETAIRLRNILDSIWEFAILKGYAKNNIITHFQAEDVGKTKHKHYDAITNPKDLGLLLKAINELKSWPLTRLALLIDAHVFVRSSELRFSVWDYINWEKKIWIIPADKMKIKRDHIIPLSNQVLGYLEEAKKYQKGDYIFCSPVDANKPLSNNILNMTMERLGFDGANFPKHVLHGFRATFRTIADEELRLPIDCIEFQLAHDVSDPLGTAYNRTTKIEDRAAMMQTWSNYLDSIIPA